MMNTDNTKEALEKLCQIMNLLYGGYYEPKSERDKELADELYDILLKYKEYFANHKGVTEITSCN